MSKTHKTTKGNELPLMNLKGKDYMMVAYRLVWLVDDVPNYTVKTQFLSMSEDKAVCQSEVSILDKEGKVIKSATATKAEDKKGFPDFIEKAETGSIGRALAILGFGTQFAIADMEEDTRLADSPVMPVNKQMNTSTTKSITPPKSVTFRKTTPPITTTSEDDI